MGVAFDIGSVCRRCYTWQPGLRVGVQCTHESAWKRAGVGFGMVCEARAPLLPSETSVWTKRPRCQLVAPDTGTSWVLRGLGAWTWLGGNGRLEVCAWG
jgi:hypothetical protein